MGLFLFAITQKESLSFFYLCKKNKNAIGKVTSYEIFDEHLQKNQNGSLLSSDHAQVVCEIEIY